MMKIFLLKYLVVIALILPLQDKCKLRIEITGMRNDTGLIMLQLLDENKNIINQAKGVIRDRRTVISFDNLVPGLYAFQYFHDENLSGVMETGPLGKPKEGYGFSNNAAGPFGPRPFKEWLFELKGDIKVTISPIY